MKGTLARRLSSTLLVCPAGALGLVWSAFIGIHLVSNRGVDRIALRIAAGEIYPSSILVTAVRQVKPIGGTVCEPALLRSAIFLSVRIAEQTLIAGEIDKIDDALVRVREASEASLSCSPGEAFAWLALFWAGRQSGEDLREKERFLLRAYVLAPNEVWLAIRRAFVSLSLYNALSVDLQHSALIDFTTVLRGGASGEAANILSGAGFFARAVLISIVAKQPELVRVAVARRLEAMGSNIEIPEFGLPNECRRCGQTR